MVKITIAADNNHEWPRTSGFLCYHCCHRFGTVPVLCPVWTKDCYRLWGNYCSWNCAKADFLVKAKSWFPKGLTETCLFAYQISFRGRNCPIKQREHPASCPCHSRWVGVKAAGNKETLKAFGGHLTIAQFRRGFLHISSYDWITRYYSPRELIRVPPVQQKYLYTLEPRRRTIILEQEEEDPVVLIKQRCF